MAQSQSAFVGEPARHQHTEAALESHDSHASHHDWHPDMSRERPEWKTAHARERGRHLPVDEHGMYTVKNGDTLFDIAIRLLKETNESTNAAAILSTVNDIARRNFDYCPELRNNPHLIQPGQVLRILDNTANALNISLLSTGDGVQASPAADENQLQPRFAATPAPVEAAPAPAQVSPADVAPPQNVGAPADDWQAPVAPPADAVQTVPTQVMPMPVPGDPPATPQPGEAKVYALPTPEQAYPVSAVPNNSFYGTKHGASYMDEQASRLSSMMVNDPHRAAAELRDQLSQLDPRSAGMLISETKNDEIPRGLGDLQIRAEFNQYGRDTGLRNVTMATPDGVEQIAELQSGPASYAGANPLGFAAGMVVGDLLWQKQRGVDFNDPQYRSWSNREQTRENYWNANHGEFVPNWKDQNYGNKSSDVPSAANRAQASVRNKAFWENQAADADEKHKQASSTQTSEQAELRREMEAEERQRTADIANTSGEDTTQQVQPKWMDRVKGAQGAQGISEQTTSLTAKDKAAYPKQTITASETATRTAREQQKQLDSAKQKAAGQPEQAVQPVVVIPQLVGVR